MRNTRQSAIILDILVNDKSHPTIKELVDKVSLVDDSLGQATVYRNILKLVNNNMIRKIPTFNGDDRYDADLSDHVHFQCNVCNKLVDIRCDEVNNFVNQVGNSTDLNITNQLILFTGTCNDCIKNKKEG